MQPGKDVAHKGKQHHNAQVVKIKENQRFLKIKIGKVGAQEKIVRQAAAEKGKDSIGADNQRPYRQRFTVLFQYRASALHSCHDHAPVYSKMQRHTHKAPVGRQQMQRAAKGGIAHGGQKREHRAGDDDRADHCPHHAQADKPCRNSLQNAEHRVPSASQPCQPAAVKPMVQDEQRKHPHPDPLMRLFPDERIGHEQHQTERHGGIHQNFYCLFFHGLTDKVCENHRLLLRGS